MWEYEPNKWLNTNYVVSVEYEEEQKKVEQEFIDAWINPNRTEAVPLLKLILLPGLPEDLPHQVEGLDRVRQALAALGIDHPILARSVSDHPEQTGSP